MKIIETLIELNVIFKMGVTKFHFVHSDYVDSWTLPADDNDYNSSSLRLSITPWINLDGNVNDKVLQNWLKVILTHCLTYPCVELQHLFNRFSYLKPVDIYSLLQVIRYGFI